MCLQHRLHPSNYVDQLLDIQGFSDAPKKIGSSPDPNCANKQSTNCREHLDTTALRGPTEPTTIRERAIK
jgi:hypothetical protein